MTKSRITVEVLVSAPLAKVWECWTKPEHIMNWNFASEDWHCPKATNKLEVGSKFNYTMASKDGKMAFDFEGIYTEVKHLEKIAYELGDGREVDIVFSAEGNSTKVVETFDPEQINTMELQKIGWQAILDNFKKCVEG